MELLPISTESPSSLSHNKNKNSNHNRNNNNHVVIGITKTPQQSSVSKVTSKGVGSGGGLISRLLGRSYEIVPSTSTVGTENDADVDCFHDEDEPIHGLGSCRDEEEQVTAESSSASSSSSSSSLDAENATNISHEEDDDPDGIVTDGIIMTKVEEHKGKKSIGMLGSLSLAVNSLAGPAILELPFTFQQAGVIPTTVCLIVVALLSALCCMHMANVVSKVPGNANFDHVVEFSDPFRVFWSPRAYIGTQIIFYLCTLCVNIAAIVDTAQIVDSFLGHSVGTWAVAFDDFEVQQWIHDKPCSRKKVKLGLCEPFSDEEHEQDEDGYGQVMLTLGYVITTIVFVPVCLMDLKENTNFQIFGFCILMSVSTMFVVCFIMDGLDSTRVSMWGETWDSMLGVILFNFGLVMAIPAWLAEKKPTVGVGKVVYASTGISVILYVGVGLIGAVAIPHVNSNMLEPMVSGAFGLPLRIAASVFAFFIIGLDIPLFSVLTRYNLVNSGLCSTRVANILVVWLPWGVGWMFYQGAAVNELLSWGGILFTGAVAFLLPLYLAIRVLQRPEAPEGSLNVYFGWIQTIQGEIRATILLLVISLISVGIAIAGQAVYDEERKFLLNSTTYVNDTTHNEGVDLLHYNDGGD